jgi:hypothetical protein
VLAISRDIYYLFYLQVEPLNRRLKQAARPSRDSRIEWLVVWLNTEKGHLRERAGDKTRIKLLISRLQTLSNALKAGELKGLADADQEAHEAAAKVREAEEAVNTCTRRYKMRPLFTASFEFGDQIENTFQPLAGGGLEEWQAIEVLQGLVAARLLDRLALCTQCAAKWIFRWREDRQYCSEKCRQSQYEASAGRKNQRKQYMKKYYRDHLSATAKKRKAERTAKHAKR